MFKKLKEVLADPHPTIVTMVTKTFLIKTRLIFLILKLCYFFSQYLYLQSVYDQITFITLNQRCRQVLNFRGYTIYSQLLGIYC